MNGWAGQRGFYCNSIPPLTRTGLVEGVDCPGGPGHDDTHFIAGNAPYVCPLDGQTYYCRIRITDAGRSAIEEATR